MDAETRKRIVEMSQGRGVPGKCSMCFVEGAEAMEKLCAEESSSPEALKRLDDTIIRQLQRAHAAELKVRDEREAKLVAALEKLSMPFDDGPGMFIARQFEDRIRIARAALAKPSGAETRSDVTGESCPKCGSTDFAVARDMIGTRHCVRCHATWLPGAKGEG